MQTPETPLRVLLVHMPVANPVIPNLAIELLAEIARNAGHRADVLYGTLLMPPGMSFEQMYGMVGQAVFAPDCFGLDPLEYAQELAEIIAGPEPRQESRIADGVIDFLAQFEAAETCLDRCLNRIPVGAYDVVGFSVGFDSQKLPSAALARRLKRREPGLRILFGGTGCDGDMAAALLERFAFVDAVLKGEGDALFLPALDALATGRGMGAVPQLVWRGDGDGGSIAMNPDRPGFDRLDSLPDPDYRSFLVQRASSPYAAGDRVLLFEGSRGCWWGDKQHCEFCGIRAVRLGFRSRGAAGVLGIIDRLTDMGADTIYATDAILDLRHLREVLPELARRRRGERPGWQLFYEIKSNAKRTDYALMAAAGVTAVQPGIESFSSDALRRIKKGATALQQVMALKWCATYGIDVIYGILVGLPGETAAELRAMVAKMRRLHHLCPPVAANPLALHAFSPYAADPARHGIGQIRPFPLQRAIYQADDPLLSRLCYERDFRIAGQDDPDYLAAREEIAQEVLAWQRDWVAGQRIYLRDLPSGMVVIRRMAQGTPGLAPVESEHAAVLRACQTIASTDKIAASAGLSEAAALAHLDALAGRGLVLGEGALWLCLAVPHGADAFADAGLSDIAETGDPRAMAMVAE